MGIRYPLPMEDTPARRRWYRKYMRELSEIQSVTYDHNDADQLYEELLDDDHWDFWVPVKHGRKVVGFFTMCPPPHCHPDVDYFLRDAYVRPQYRRLGAMQKAVTRWLQLYPGKYTVLVLKSNKPAYLCWLNVFERAGYEQFELRELEEFDDVKDVIILGFKPKEEA